MFLGPSPKERKRVGLVQGGREFTLDLLMQGIVGYGIKLLDEVVIENIYPTSWFDLNKRTIKQTAPLLEYSLLRFRYFVLEWRQYSGEDVYPASILYVIGWFFSYFFYVANNCCRKEGLFKAPKNEFLHAPLVSHIIGEVFRLPLGIREGWVTWGFRSLIRKATAMIKHAEAELY